MALAMRMDTEIPKIELGMAMMNRKPFNNNVVR